MSRHHHLINTKDHNSFAIVTAAIAAGEPVSTVTWEPMPMGPRDSGFFCTHADFGLPFVPQESADEPPLKLVCLHCLLKEQPLLRGGLELARREGGAYWEGDEWHVLEDDDEEEES